MIAITAPWMIKEESSYKYCSHKPFTQTTITFFNNNSDSYITNSYELVGGKNEKCDILEKIGQHYVEQQHPQQDVEEMGELKDVNNKFDVEKIKNPYIIDPTQYHTQEELFNAIKHWWIFKYRKNEGTIKDRLRYAGNMAAHNVFPINWFDLNPIQIIAYLEYKEYQEYNNERGKHQIINEWKTIKTFAKAFGIDASLWGYIPPSPPKPKVQIVPLPNTTYEMIQHDYSKDLYKNALVQYILIHGFLIGWRPSELLIQKASDVFLEDGYLIITETKKNRQPRQIFPEPDIMTNPRRKSMKNWIEH
jgi:integrase